MPERRKHARYPFIMPVRGRLVDAEGHEHAFDAETMNVSLEGLAILYHDEASKMKMLEAALSDDQPVALVLTLPGTSDRIDATGVIRWYKTGGTDPSFHYLIAGLFLKGLEPDQKDQWQRLIEDRARITREAMRLLRPPSTSDHRAADIRFR